MNRRHFLASIVALPVVARALTAGEPDLYIPPGAQTVYITNLSDKTMTLKHEGRHNVSHPGISCKTCATNLARFYLRRA